MIKRFLNFGELSNFKRRTPTPRRSKPQLPSLLNYFIFKPLVNCLLFTKNNNGSIHVLATVLFSTHNRYRITYFCNLERKIIKHVTNRVIPSSTVAPLQFSKIANSALKKHQCPGKLFCEFISSRLPDQI